MQEINKEKKRETDKCVMINEKRDKKMKYDDHNFLVNKLVSLNL